MSNKQHKTGLRGQTALILILLAAAALIFLSITLNWGHMAQTKSLLTIAADQGATLLASDAASYGEMLKQQYLGDVNKTSSVNWQIVISILVVIIAVVIAIVSWGSAAPVSVALIAATLAAVMAVVSLALQLCVVQPGIMGMWNKLQKNQSVQQQFYEQGMGTALMGAITDQIQITDYFDLNTNGKFGSVNGFPNDTVSRFAFFYTDRLKMLNQGYIPQVKFFYNQLKDFMDGETCSQNFVDHDAYPGVPLNPSCLDTTGTDFCGIYPQNPSSDPACQMKIPDMITCTQNVSEHGADATIPLNAACATCSTSNNPLDPSCQLTVSNAFSFQLNDSCSDWDINSTTYNPACDPCCQPVVLNGKTIRPSSCMPAGYPAACTAKPDGVGCYCTANPTASGCVPSQCTGSSNPYGAAYPFIYDASYQEFSNGISFLDQYGRDQTVLPLSSTLPLNTMTPIANFPNGVYPFFWMMKNYSPEVDNINPTTGNLSVSQNHWCVQGTPTGPPPPSSVVPLVNAPTGFTELTQLGQSPFTLPYTCQGQDCCVNFLMSNLPNSAPNVGGSAPIVVIVGSGITVSVTTNPTSYSPGDTIMVTGYASEAAPGSIASINFQITGLGINELGSGADNLNNYTEPGIGTTAVNFSGTISIPNPACASNVVLQGPYTITATATDANGNQLDASTAPTIINPTACSSAYNCGPDSCGNSCGSCPPASDSTLTSCSSTTTPGNCVVPPSPPGPGDVRSAVPSVSKTQGIKGSSTVTTSAQRGSVSLSQNLPTVKPANGPSPAPVSPTVTISSPQTDTTYSLGDSITITATVSGGNSATQVVFYYGQSSTSISTFLGIATNSPYSYTWVNPPAGTYYISAAVTSSGTTAPTTVSNGPIDMVGASAGAMTSVFPLNVPDPTGDTSFGEAGLSIPAHIYYDPSGVQYTIPSINILATRWQPADNQMCMPTWPYNAAMGSFPDGTCEWTNSATPPSSPGSALNPNVGIPPVPGVGNTVDSSGNPLYTVDSLDDTMHTLSDFVKWANGSILLQDLSTLSSTFDTWYPSAAAWIAPQCSTTQRGKCTSSDPGCTFGSCTLDTDPDCTMSDYSCGSKPGRLLDIYNPNVNPPVDKLNDWNTLLTVWLNNSYTPVNSTSTNVWCIPTESTQSGLEVTENGKTVPTSEDAYIKANATTATWGDLPHVIACLNYNAGVTPTQSIPNASSYQNCLNDLTSTCPTTLPNDCASSKLGYSSSVVPPIFSGTHRCDAYYIDATTGPTYANWVGNQINFGPQYNYQNCLNLLTNACPAGSAASLANTVCDPSVLGRSLLAETVPAFSGTAKEPSSKVVISCDPTYADSTGAPSYAKWVKDSLTVFTDESPKFVLRSNFLNSVYSRVQTLQNITAQGDEALHNFLKPCGSAPSCVDGGPAAQLIWARSQGDPTTPLPNATIYGWKDTKSTGSGGCMDLTGTKRVGCAHIVKVTAFSPGRNNGAPFVWPLLPWIYASTAWEIWIQPPFNVGAIPWLENTLSNRNGYVYVSVKRWDQDHTNPVTFPNGHSLWQFVFHNPNPSKSAIAGLGRNGLPSACMGLPAPSALQVSQGFGYGLQQQTLEALNAAMSPNDSTTITALENAFMLNDNGNGRVDSSNISSGGSCAGGGSNGGGYCTCLGDANLLLNSGTESHACAQYIASRDASGPANAGNPGHCEAPPPEYTGPAPDLSDPPPCKNERDYSLKFVDCNSIPGYLDSNGNPVDDKDMAYSSAAPP
jgi:hypothetical protein